MTILVVGGTSLAMRVSAMLAEKGIGIAILCEPVHRFESIDMACLQKIEHPTAKKADFKLSASMLHALNMRHKVHRPPHKTPLGRGTKLMAC